MSDASEPLEEPIELILVEAGPPEIAPRKPILVRLNRPGPGLLASFGWLFLLLFLQILFGFALGFLFGMHVLGWSFFPAVTTFNVAFALIVLLTTYRKNALYHMGLRMPSVNTIVLTLLITPTMGILACELAASTIDVFQWIHAPAWMSAISDSDEISDLKKYDQKLVTLGIILLGGLFPAISEELLFRGIIGRGLVARWGVYPGVILTSFLFSLAHLVPIQVVVTFFLGIILHTVYLWSRSLIAPMIVHAAYNTVVIHAQLLTVGQVVELKGDAHVPIGLVLTSAGLFIWLMILLMRIRVRWMLPSGKKWSPGFATGEKPHRSIPAMIQEAPLSRIAPYFVLFLFGAWLAHAALALK